MTQRKRWLKTREFEKGECVAVRRPGKVDTDRNAKRPPFVCVLVWVYFVHERFERGLSEARMAEATVEETAFEDVNMWQAHPLTPYNVPHTPLGIRRAGCFLLLCISQTPEMHPRPFFGGFWHPQWSFARVFPHPQGIRRHPRVRWQICESKWLLFRTLPCDVAA